MTTAMTTAMPPVGPLATTENLLPGDILRTIWEAEEDVLDISRPKAGANVTVENVLNRGTVACVAFDGLCDCSRFAFVARPGVWMPWTGGENPVPGMKVNVRLGLEDRDETRPEPSVGFRWSHNGLGADITEYMVVTEAQQPRKGDPVPLFGSQSLPQGVSETLVAAFADVLNGRVNRVNEPGKWTVSRDDNRVIYEAHDDASTQSEQKSVEPAVDAKTAAADAVRAAAEALNDAIRKAGREGVMSSLSIQEAYRLRSATQVAVTCTTRV